MERRYSDMTHEELSHEILKLKEAAMKKHQAGFYSEAAVLEQKFYMAKSYMMNPTDFSPGQQYHVIGHEGVFTIQYMNGVMAWGHLEHSPEEEAFPISRLIPLS